MKKQKMLYIIVGIIIGLGIAVNYNLTTATQAKNSIFTESDKNADDYVLPSKPFIEATSKVKDSVVYIYTEKTIKYKTSPYSDDPFRDFFGDEFFKRFFGDRFEGYRGSPQERPREKQYKQQGLGSGFIISSDGYIVTNNHVIEEADEIKVKLNNKKEYTAKVIGSDKKSDIAVIKIDTDDLNYVKLGDSDKLRIGEWIIAIGNPFGLMQTVTTGIVSAKGRGGLRIEEYEDFIQIDAAINPGNSGGPMINLNGDVVGVNTAIYSKSGGNMGIGFAIPINMAKKIINDLVNRGKVVRGYLGVTIQDLNEDLSRKFNTDRLSGVLISQVMENTPAERAGIKRGDIIIEFNGKKISHTNELRNVVANTPINSEVKIIVLRKNREKKLYVTIEEQPKDFDRMARSGPGRSYSQSKDWIGIEAAELNSELADKYGYDKKTKGVVITKIDRNSIAEEYNLKEGDIILEIEQKPVETLEDFDDMIDKARKSKTILFTIKRGYSVMYIIVRNDK